MVSPLKLITNENHITRQPKVVLTQAMPTHIRELVNNLQPEDEKEILAFGVNREKILWRAYRRAIIRRVGLIDGKVAGCWGCGGTFMGTKGHPFLLTTAVIREISPLRIARIYQAEVIKMLEIFPYLEDYVDSSYTGAIRLLKIVGFEVGEPEPMGRKGEMFCKFWKGVR